MPSLVDVARLFHTDAPSLRGFASGSWTGRKSRKKHRLPHRGFSLLAAATDILAIFASATLIAVIHHLTRSGLDGDFVAAIEVDIFAGFIFVAISALRNDYAIHEYLRAESQLRRTFAPWCIAFAIALVIALSLTPPSGHPPLPIAVFFVASFAAVWAARLGLAHATRTQAAQGRIAAKRLFLIGFEAELEAFTKRFERHGFGMHIVAASVLRGADSLAEDLALARAYARILEPDDVMVLVPWTDTATTEAAINAFLGIPAAIHLGPERVLDRFTGARIAKLGSISSLNLIDHPLSPSARFCKRLFDLVLASLGLVILAPLLILVAIAIKLDSPGPVIFRQHRYGFNQQPFRIFKFRSMTTCEDGAGLVQVAIKNDARVTRVGAFLRRHNIDELPQLLNVILGEMSLVGPRPMAVMHDQMFEPYIALYARRHNVKPGITGWAQINGCRGGLSEERIRARVEHDIYYIDHWSMWFDIKILWLTIASKHGYLDAY